MLSRLQAKVRDARVFTVGGQMRGQIQGMRVLGGRIRQRCEQGVGPRTDSRRILQGTTSGCELLRATRSEKAADELLRTCRSAGSKAEKTVIWLLLN